MPCPPPSLCIDLRKNQVSLSPGGEHRFTHRWEALFLLLLLEQDPGASLSAASLNRELARHGQTQPLNRSQVQRLVTKLHGFLERIPNAPLRLEHAPRKATTGPWRLVAETRVAFTLVGPRTPAKTSVPGIRPQLLIDGELSEWRGLLEACMISDSFADQGKFIEAQENFAAIHAFPLTPEARTLFKLCEARYDNILGNRAEARHTLKTLLANPAASRLADPNLLAYARFYLERIEYDETPAQSFRQLWRQGQPPASADQINPIHAAEWHNLRALLARRMLHAHPAGEVSPETPADFHPLALAHFQAAMYWALALRNWEKLQAFTANLAYHLQSVIALGLTSAAETYAWYSLVYAYSDKLNAGEQSSWSVIFFGEFWLDHEDELSNIAQGHGTAVANEHPSEESFYTDTISAVESSGDTRQIAFAWINYLRFAQRHLSRPYVKRAEYALNKLFQIDGTLRAKLEAEGYGVHLPGKGR